MASAGDSPKLCTDRPSQFKIDVCTHIGGRPRQEDRFFVRNDITVAGDNEVGFFGIWDGTVDQHASDFVHTRCCGHHLASSGFQEYTAGLQNGNVSKSELAQSLVRATEQGYFETDKECIESCRQLRNHYSSCTSVTCIVTPGLLTVGHLGDSRCYLLEHGGDQLRGSCLTDDHKPDDPEERRRIESSGGSIQLLTHHHNKPFIRGGDFDRRKATGERVMQLQYSRAFGGKDLKPFGLSSVPTVRQVELDPNKHAGFVLCSDGVSDVCSAENAALIVAAARARGEDPAATLVGWAMNERARVGIGADNITAVVVWFNPN